MNRTLKLLSSVFFLFLSLALHAQSSYCDSVKTIFSNTPGIGTTNYNPDDLVVALDSAFGATHYDSASAQYLPNTLSYWFAQLLICGDSCTHIVSCDSINTAISQLSSYQIVPDSTTSYSLPFIENYLSIRFPAYQLDKPSWDAILHCCAPPSVNFSDTLLQRCDTTAIVRFVLQNNIPSVDSCLPYWVYNYIMTEIGFGVDSNIYQLCNDLTNCNIKCLPFCTDTFPTACDSLNSVYYVYRQLLASEQTGGIPSSDTALLEKAYSALYGQYLPPGQVMAEIATCNQDSSLLTVITYSAQNLHFSTVSGQTFIDLDVFAIDSPANLLYSQSNIFIQYDTTVFGSNLVSNNKITATKGQVIDSPYYIISMSDSASNLLKIAVTHSDSASSQPTIGSNQQLCHLKINVSGFNLTAIAAAWDTMAMVGHSLYQRTISGLEFPYDIVRVNGLVGAVQSAELAYDLTGFSTTVSPGSLFFYLIARSQPPTSFSDGQIIINYDTLAFGTGLASNINFSYIVISSNDGASVADFAPGQLIVNINNSNSQTAFDQLSNTADSLMIFYLPISDCTQSAGVSIDQGTDTLTSDYYDSYSQGTATYSQIDVLYGSDYNIICPPLYPVITGISSDCIGAGTFDTLIIYGNNFGNTQGTVYFNSIDSQAYYFPVFYRNIISWTDNQIQLYIPSFPFTAGSGWFFVETSAGLYDSARINVGFSLMNFFNTSDSSEIPVFRSDRAWVFQLDSNLWNIPGVIATVRHVMADMNCQAGVQFSLDTTGPSSATTPIKDSINLISIQPNTYSRFYNKPNVMGYTERYIKAYPCALPQYNNYAYQLQEADISFRSAPTNTSYSWNWSDANTPTYSQDDFAAFLIHELGHAAGLDHVWPFDYSNVMYPVVARGPTHRTFDSDPNDLLGLYRILSMGATLGTACGVGYATQVFGAGCPHFGATCWTYFTTLGIDGAVARPAFNAYLYPNPYEGSTVIHIDVSGYGDYTIGIYDMIGRQVLTQNISSGTSFDVPLSGFQESVGMYLIQVSDGHSAVVLKMIKL